jgi:EmrB/QacA subfamily drug resistance transporter
MTHIFKAPCDEAAIEARRADSVCSPAAGPWVLAATILGSSMAFIDGTAVNVALPALQHELDATVAGVQWVVEAYSLMLAALILVGGSLGDHYGRRRVFSIGVVVFALSSITCGLSQTLLQLIVARLAQGIGGVVWTPGSRAIISASFEGEQRGRAIGTWSGFTALTSAAGPVMGGWLVQVGSWRYVFFLNVPIAAVVLVLALRHVPESRGEGAASRLDWRGALLATFGLGGLVYGFVSASTAGFAPPRVWLSLAAGACLLVAFVWTEGRLRTAMMPLDLFRSRSFSGSNLFTLLLYAALGGALFFVPFNLQQVHGYSPQAAGAALLPFVLLLFLLSRWAGGLVGRYGGRPPLIVGPLVVAVGFLLFARPGTGGSYWTTFFPAVVVLGLGMATAVAPLSTTVMTSVDDSRAGLASGVNNAVSRTAGVLAVAVLSLFLVLAFDRGLENRVAGAPPAVRAEVLEQRSKLAAIDLSGIDDAEERSQLQDAVGASYVDGFRLVMIIAAGLALAASMCAAVTIEPKPAATEEAEGGRASPFSSRAA